MEIKNCKVELVEKVSKAGKPYKVVELTLPNGYVKTVFIDLAEQFVFDSLVQR